MIGAQRQNRKSEEIFRMEIWGMLPNFAACLWYGKDLAANTIEQSRMIRKSLEKLEAQIEEEFPGASAAVDRMHAPDDSQKLA